MLADPKTGRRADCDGAPAGRCNGHHTVPGGCVAGHGPGLAHTRGRRRSHGFVASGPIGPRGRSARHMRDGRGRHRLRSDRGGDLPCRVHCALDVVDLVGVADEVDLDSLLGSVRRRAVPPPRHPTPRRPCLLGADCDLPSTVNSTVLGVMRSTVASRWIFTPSSLACLTAVQRRGIAIGTPSCLPSSTRVTRLPRSARNSASSRPTSDPPMTTTFLLIGRNLRNLRLRSRILEGSS